MTRSASDPGLYLPILLSCLPIHGSTRVNYHCQGQASYCQEIQGGGEGAVSLLLPGITTPGAQLLPRNLHQGHGSPLASGNAFFSPALQSGMTATSHLASFRLLAVPVYTLRDVPCLHDFSPSAEDSGMDIFHMDSF